jgi:hypothetical protein
VAAAGYSGTPLPAKLGLRPGQRVLTLDAPPNLAALLAGAPADLAWLREPAPFDLALVFAGRVLALKQALTRLTPLMPDGGMIWVAWPKRASGVPTDLTEDVVRAAALAASLVDVKVCAIDATWSGLKLVRRVRDRAAAAPQRRRGG